jgi:alpha-tubulin suppressor-like RCC1 family protein
MIIAAADKLKKEEKACAQRNIPPSWRQRILTIQQIVLGHFTMFMMKNSQIKQHITVSLVFASVTLLSCSDMLHNPRTSGPPVISVQPVSQSVPLGQTVEFLILASGKAPLSYQWRKDSVDIPGASAASLTIDSVTFIDEGRYSVIVSNSVGSETSRTASLTIATSPVITIQPRNLTVFLGENATFYVNTEGTPSPNYQWIRNDTLIPGAIANTYSINATVPQSTGAYAVIVDNVAGSDTSDAVRLDVVGLFQDAQSMALGRSHSVIVDTHGTLWACGDNYYGQLGTGDTTGRRTPVPVMTGVRLVSAGYDHTMILKTDGTLWACGKNVDGQLGDGTREHRNRPVQIMSRVQSVSAGSSHTMILKEDGTLWGCGWNQDGELGTGDSDYEQLPQYVTDNVKCLAAGGAHTVICKADQTLWACGLNRYGQLGDNTTIERHTLVRLASITGPIRTISCGDEHTMILKEDGTLWACGTNIDGRLGIPSTAIPMQVDSGVINVATGGNHTMIIKSDQSYWAFGENSWSQLGDGLTVSPSGPKKIMNGSQSIAAGYRHSMILGTDGILWACGNRDDGQLGNETDYCVSVKVTQLLQ